MKTETYYRRWGIVGGAVILLGGIAFGLFLSAGASPPLSRAAEVSPREHRVPVEENSVELLRAEVAAVRAELQRIQTAQVAKGAESKPGPELAEKPSKTRPTAEELEAEEAAVVERLDHRIAAETRDPEWSPAAEAALSQLADVAGGDRVISLECQSSLCRGELEHTSADAQERWMERVAMFKMRRGATMVKPVNGEGGIRSLLYVAREGHPLTSKHW
jgi:hypothetical protein